MAYRELVFRVSADVAESLGDALMEIGALSISVLDADADTEEENPLYGEPGMTLERQAWNQSHLQALFNSELWDENPSISSEIVQSLIDAGFQVDLPLENVIADQDWVRLTQSQFEPIQVGQRIWVVPSWHVAPELAKNTGAICLEVDPGLAFGTGSHPTTKLCLQWLEELSDQSNLTNKSVLDYGCGSGILAIAAKKLGAGQTFGVDIDPQSISSGIENAQRNNVQIQFDLPESDDNTRIHDVVVANILANPLLVLAPALCQRLNQQGKLVLSGILERHANMVIQAYAPWISLSVWKEMDGWVALTGQVGSQK